ncbi:MAG: hypothetical protein KJO54_06165 [Gammaproteobacteria bacterium]|nr:hypothetical protein [Gammaproteobacteria bacterium]NNF61218.1 hypothetical protein [Gammaproteobacteria bacterium]NNM20804.1 hypothetical protein [Gammaproteobacteria bacterium]
MSNILIKLMLALAVVTLSACGSDGNDFTVAPTPQPPAQGAITTDNAQDLTQDVLEGVTSLFDATEMINVIGLPLPGAFAAASDFAVAGDTPFARLYGFKPAVPRVGGPIVDTGDCDAGTYTSTWMDMDLNFQITTGDTFDLVFDGCFWSDPGITLVGDAAITGIEITGDVLGEIPPWTLAFTIDCEALSGTDVDQFEATMSGGFSLAAETQNGLIIELSLTGDSVSWIRSGDTDTLIDFVVDEIFDFNTMTATLDAVGSLDSTVAGETVTFETMESFVIIGEGEPSAGQLLITAADSSVLVSVIDNISLELSVDTDNDGVRESTFNITWEDLDLD